MSHLRLVAGTAVTGIVRKTTKAPTKRPARLEVDVNEREEQARAVIRGLKPGLDGKSVRELLAEMNRNRVWGYMPPIQAIQRNGHIRRALMGIGIHTHAAHPEQELDVALYGLVVDRKRMLKACPALKSCAHVLEGLAL